MSLAIPPAWTEVWIAPEADAHLLATGRDADGRKQYLYHPEWRAAADMAKFAALSDVGGRLSTLRREVEDDLRRASDRWPVAAAVRLIDDSLIRPGSRRNLTRHGSVGASTLRIEHLVVRGGNIELRFDGKSGVEHEIGVHDPLLARRLAALIDRDPAEGGEFVFVDGDGPVTDARINDYIAACAGEGFTCKALRTWGATCVAAQVLVEHDVADADADASIRAAIEAAADRLGNTVAVCRSAYVAPQVVDAVRSGDLAAAWRRSRRTRWLSRTENAVRHVLGR
jgi:DNA topoisomerase-1